MNKNKRLPIILAIVALLLSGCGHKPKPSSIISSDVAPSSEVENSSVAASSEVLSSELSSEAISSSEDISSTISSSEIASEVTISSEAQSSSEMSSSAISSSQASSSSTISSSSAQSSSTPSSSSSSAPSSSPSSSSSSSTPSSYIEPDPVWNVDLSLRGAQFRNALQAKMAAKKTNTTSYSNCLSLGAQAAAYPTSSSSTFVPFYHDASVTATTSQCNREHTWPDSRGSGKSGPGADPFIIRPTLISENSDRSNYFYGLRGKNNREWDPASCGFEGARGESARVILYAATMYYSNGFSLSNNPYDDTSLKTMGTLSTLLTWNNAYAPTPIEIQINDYLSDHGYGRNPFVDHPEYANYIWDSNGLIGEDVPPDPSQFDDGLDVENTLTNLDGNEYVIASTDSSTSNSFYVMDNEAKDGYPWYIKPITALVNEDKTKLIPNGDVTFKYYKFIKQSDGNYYIQSKETNNYIFGYIDGTHYSIGLGTTPTNNGSLSWTITKSSEGFVFKNAANVYLEFYRGSFCGYSSAPSIPIYLFH